MASFKSPGNSRIAFASRTNQTAGNGGEGRVRFPGVGTRRLSGGFIYEGDGRFRGESMLEKDIYVMDSKHKKSSERVVQVRRVTKVVKGGKQLKFRAIVVVGDKQGNVRVGCAKAKEVVAAVQKSAIDARRNIVQVPMTKYSTFPHRSEGDYGAAKVMLRPASPGTGLIAGGAVRIVLEMAGVENALGKQLGSNNARATLAAVQQMRQFRDVAQERGIPMEELCK
ncbi:hypothetical protein ARALYDRAFT_343774 [Arabidopsis lyrata subsp. lyrata]|uniref:Small ribosomal subunit protein uS5c n=1 Tax=Arabidopsis lyrata subsp. lyrata TaxID=81972 RepID=D7LDB5_ARALL|nr:hypothetical protein ARALYDRAFT_343774 [Arabidopsis lyrata subsp. lyrata]